MSAEIMYSMFTSPTTTDASCFVKGDDYFACLDSKGYEYTTKPSVCPEEYKLWYKACSPNIRKMELFKRFNQKKLEYYADKKNLKW